MKFRNALAVLSALVALPAWGQSSWEPLPASAPKRATPSHLIELDRLPRGSVTRMQRASAKSGEWALNLPDGGHLRIVDATTQRHANGDISYSGAIEGAGFAYSVFATEGADASFGLWATPRGRYRFESWRDQGWLVRLDHPDLIEETPDREVVLDSATAWKASAVRDAAPASKARAGTQIDVLLLYSAGFAARYPGSASETRVRHLVGLANQIIANSAVDLALRVVGIDATTYNDTDSNSAALGALRSSLESVSSAVPGLEGLRARRNATGADLVTMIRPHDIETRGSCGIARLFVGVSTQGVNVVSDGFSSWSICSEETYAHEVGHNLGAEHQVGATSSNPGFGTAHVVLGQYNTVMGSFGTGDPNRGLRLQRFSNPQQLCGGEPCGVVGVADNARRLRANMNAVAGYMSAVSSAPDADAPVAVDPDIDGDGVPESQDAFPHDGQHSRDRDFDGVADGLDAFPDNQAESLDTDRDLIGDNSDPDRDGDGVLNAVDALPLVATESVDSDADGVGDNADAFDGDRREWGDVDRDSIGDNADADSDGDGLADFDANATDLLVASIGTDRVLRLDGASGRLIAIEISEAHAPFALGPKSALTWNPYRRRVDALIASEVRRYDPFSRQREARVLRSFRSEQAPGLRSGLSSAFAVGSDGTLFVADSNSNSLHRFDAVSAAERTGGAFSDQAYFSNYPRALLTTAQGGLWTVDRAGLLGEVDVTSGAQRRTQMIVLPESTSALADPAALATGPDGALYLADARTDRVLRLSPNDGLLRVFVPAGAGGLDQPAGLAFDAQDRLYVASVGTHQVLRYDRAGVFVDVFSQTPAGTLSQPRALAFVPRVADRYPRDAARRFRPRVGAWYNPANSGQGVELQAVPGGLGFAWYTYDADGRPTWYLAAGALQGESWSASLQRYTWDGQRATPRDVGRVELSFTAEDRAQFHWELEGQSGTEPLEHFQSGRSVETQFPTAMWYPPTMSGWGYSVHRQGEVLAIIAFFYDRNGQPTWALGATEASSSDLTLLRYREPGGCPGCAGNTTPTSQTAGSLRFTVQDDMHATTRIDVADQEVDWHYDGVSMERLTASPTLPDGSPRP